MDEIRSTIRFQKFRVNGVYMDKTCEFIVFDWRKDNNRQYYAFDISTRTITSLGNYNFGSQGQIQSHQDGYGLLLVEFY